MSSSLIPKTWRLRFAIVVAGGLSCWYLVRVAPLPFVSAWWQPHPPEWHDSWYLRHRMADGLVLFGRLNGAPRSDVVSLLGEPPDHGYFNGHDLVYQLGSERRFLGIDSEWLAIRLDSSGFVSDVEIVRD